MAYYPSYEFGYRVLTGKPAPAIGDQRLTLESSVQLATNFRSKFMSKFV